MVGEDGIMSEEPADKRERPDLVMVELLHEEGVQNFYRSDRKVATFPLDSEAGLESFRRSLWLLDPPSLFFETRRGDFIEAEIPQPWSMADRGGRPVIYLDQNGWSTLAKAIHDRPRVDPKELPGALHLIDLAMRRQVILPMSFAHLSETTQWGNNDGRYSLALTLLQLSRGWQMRDPLTMRLYELRRELSHALLDLDQDVPPAFTLEPNAINGNVSPIMRPEGFTDQDAFTFAALLAPSVYFSLALSPEPSPRGEPGTWKEGQQIYTDWLRRETARAKDSRRKSAMVKAFADAQTELARAAASLTLAPEQLSVWVRSSWFKPLKHSPAYGLFRETYVDRHLAGARWENNDLTDLFYLSTAAAYADHVLAERRTGANLRQAGARLGLDLKVSTSFAELVDHLPAVATN
jgi:hypothetical protein